MTTLVVEELRTTLYQEFSLKTKESIKAIRPYLYLHNSPAGTFTLTLKESGATIDSKSYTAAQIEAAAGFTANQYHHAYINFEFDSHLTLKRDTTYRIELSSAGYTFGDAAYVGWIRPHENGYNNSSPSLINYESNPFGYQLWGIK